MRDDIFDKLLTILIDNSSRILLAGFGLGWAEATFFDIIRLLRQEDSLKSNFLSKVRSTFAISSLGGLTNGEVPAELIELVAHELRWPELLELAQQRIHERFGGDMDFAAGDVASRLFEAYKDDWEDREFYRRYREGLT
jgi:hypothetical protein